jgi:tetratricopeptide (TPR) repeat protein
MSALYGSAIEVSLGRARTIVRVHDVLGRLHRRGYRWVRCVYLPCLRRLEAASSRTDRRLAARGWSLIGRLHDLNGTPRAAQRAFTRWMRLVPNSSDPWRAIAAMHDAMGEYDRARHALLRALRIDADDDGARAELERIEWAIMHGCPALYDEDSAIGRASEHVAAGRAKQALVILSRKRTPRYRRMRARAHGARGAVDSVLAEWTAFAETAHSIQLQHGDWFYSFQGETGEDPRLWRLLLWKVRPKLEGSALSYSPSLDELDVPDQKRFELYTRFELAQTEGDVAALLALAASYPSWREPGEVALRMGTP